MTHNSPLSQTSQHTKSIPQNRKNGHWPSSIIWQPILNSPPTLQQRTLNMMLATFWKPCQVSPEPLCQQGLTKLPAEWSDEIRNATMHWQISEVHQTNYKLLHAFMQQFNQQNRIGQQTSLSKHYKLTSEACIARWLEDLPNESHH